MDNVPVFPESICVGEELSDRKKNKDSGQWL